MSNRSHHGKHPGCFIPILLGLVACSSDPSTPTSPNPAGVDAGHTGPETVVTLGDKAEQLQQALESWAEVDQVVGAAMTVRTQQGEKWEGAAGLADKTSGRPVQAQDFFRIASVTKHFAVTLVLSLVEQGRLDLDAPLNEFRPSFPDADKITVRMLLNHTSGVRDYQSSERFKKEALSKLGHSWTPDEVIQFAIDDGPVFAPPGSDYAYSNTGYLLIGLVLEEVSGMSAHALLRQQILRPVGLNQTFLYPAEHIPPDDVLVSGYSFIAGPELDLSVLPQQALDSLGWTAGGLVSTTDDVCRFGLALMGKELLQESSKAQMYTGVPYETSDERIGGYGLGSDINSYRGYVAYGHGGSMPGYVSQLTYVPQLGLSVTVMTNSEKNDPEQLAFRVIDIVKP
jgi:D-alanyl-D-alanine carboxypeptidase